MLHEPYVKKLSSALRIWKNQDVKIRCVEFIMSFLSWCRNGNSISFFKPDINRAWRPANTDYVEAELQTKSQSPLVIYGVLWIKQENI